ncbi:hypothetical protein DENSPDRAFT_661605 [Dentipellis sp. KUC8613]|nr:hypothetical protein DENSPDRAFT_661605 [Dentipellis sp. KUC8613]
MDSLFPFLIAGITMVGSVGYMVGYRAAVRSVGVQNQRQTPAATTRRRRTRKRRRHPSLTSGGPPGGPDVSDITEPDSRKRKTPPTSPQTQHSHFLDDPSSPQIAERERKRTWVSDNSNSERDALPPTSRINESTSSRIPVGMGHLLCETRPTLSSALASPQHSEIQSSGSDIGYWQSRIDAGDLAGAGGVTPSPQLVSRATSADFVQGSSSRPLPPRTSLQASAAAPHRHHRRLQNARAAAEREHQRQRVHRTRTPTPAPVSARPQPPERPNDSSFGQSTNLPSIQEIFPWLRPLTPGEAEAARVLRTPPSPAPHDDNYAALFSSLALQTFPRAYSVDQQPEEQEEVSESIWEQPATAVNSLDYSSSQLPPDSLLYSSWEPPISPQDYESQAASSAVDLACPPTPSYLLPPSETAIRLRAQMLASSHPPSPMPAATLSYPMPPLVVPRARYPGGSDTFSSNT